MIRVASASGSASFFSSSESVSSYAKIYADVREVVDWALVENTSLVVFP
jgi:hypothetical protein